MANRHAFVPILGYPDPVDHYRVFYKKTWSEDWIMISTEYVSTSISVRLPPLEASARPLSRSGRTYSLLTAATVPTRLRAYGYWRTN
jgi:hypothetical protein